MTISYKWRGKLIATGSNAKTVKGDGSEYVTAIMYLAPARNVARINVCAMAKLAGCDKACLYKAGRGVMSNVEASRKRKTEWFRDDRAAFMAQLVSDIEKFEHWAKDRAVQAVVRLNGTSDIRWELINIERFDRVYNNVFEAFPNVQFYDYTKLDNRDVATLDNYHLTLSYSAASLRFADYIVAAADRDNMNVAVVFRSPAVIPAQFLGRKVVDGDKDDLRFLDPDGVVVALYAKGPAKHDQSGFVIDMKGAAQ